MIADNVVYLVITDKSYPRKLAFSYLDELSKEFATSYGAKVEAVRKPYAFVGFGMSTMHISRSFTTSHTLFLDTFMSKTTRLYQDTRTAGANGGAMDKLNDELQDVTRIMTKNMEELLWRGDSLDSAWYCFLTVGNNTDGIECRDVAPVHVFALGVGEVPQGGAEHQHPGHAATICAHRRCAVYYYSSDMVEVLMRPLLWTVACLYIHMTARCRWDTADGLSFCLSATTLYVYDDVPK